MILDVSTFIQQSESAASAAATWWSLRLLVDNGGIEHIEQLGEPAAQLAGHLTRDIDLLLGDEEVARHPIMLSSGADGPSHTLLACALMAGFLEDIVWPRNLTMWITSNEVSVRQEVGGEPVVVWRREETT